MPVFRKEHIVGFYIHIPKTAGTSVTKMLRNIGCRIALDGGNIRDVDHFNGVVKKSRLLESIHEKSPCNPQHIHKELYNCVIDHSKIRFNFTVVRDPVERMYSEYLWLGRKYSPSAEYCSGCSTYDQSKWSMTTNFSEWLKYMKDCYDEDPYVWDNHLRKQTEFILDDTKVFRFDQLGKIMNYLNESMQMNHHPIPLPHLNRRRPKDNVINIEDEDKELIRNWYKDDYELYHSIED